MKYDLIYADCAWQYKDNKGNDPAMGGITYDVMSLEDLKSLPIKQISNKNSVVLMWATMPLLQECLDVMKSWGFTYITCFFTWVKLNPNATLTEIPIKGKKQPNILIDGGIYSGLGSHSCGNAELVLLGKKGKGLKRYDKSVKQIQIHPRSRHSQKPKLHSEIERIWGTDIKRCELFARDITSGWDCFGNELDGRDLRDTLLDITIKE